MSDFDENIKNIFSNEEIPFNPGHWEQMKERLSQSEQPTPFEEQAKFVFNNAPEVPVAEGMWNSFEQKLNESAYSSFEKEVKDKFSSAEVAYNAKHWENLSKQLDSPDSPYNLKVRDLFNQEKVSYNPSHWAQMERMLDKQSGKLVLGWKKIAAGAAVLLFGWLTYAAINNYNQTDKVVNNTDAKENHKKNTSVAEKNKNAHLKENEPTSQTNITLTNPNQSTNKSTAVSTNKQQEFNAVTLLKEPLKTVKKKNIKSLKYNHKQNENILQYTSNYDENSDVMASEDAVSTLVSNYYLFHFANKNLLKEEEMKIDSISYNNIDNDWSGSIFKYATLPSVLPNAILSNFWEHPSIAGSDGKLAFKFLYNSNWENKVVDKYTSEKEFKLIEPANMYFATDGKIGKIGLGAYYHRIHNNDFRSDNANITASYTYLIDKFTSLKAGVSATYTNNSLEKSQVNFWAKENDVAILKQNDKSVNTAERYININSGVWLSHPLVFGGLTLNNIAQITLTKKNELQLNTPAIAGINLPLSKKITTTLYGKRITNIKALWTGGAVISYNNKLFVGGAYENSNFITTTLGYNIKNQLRLSFTCGIEANKESMYINDDNHGFVSAGIRYLIQPTKSAPGFSL